MRDALVLGFILAALLVTLRYPFVGLLTWAWFTLLTPHQLAYGTFGVPLNTVIALVTIVSMVAHGEFRRSRLDAITVLMLMFSVWLVVAQQFSLDPARSGIYFDRFIKLMLFAVLCAQLASDRLRVHAMLWILVLSMGYFGLKGGLFTIATLGQYRVQGVENTVLEDNNHLGIALASTLPLMLYLRGEAANTLVRHGLSLVFAMTIIAILGTHSRGAFLSLIVFGGYYWLRSSRKISILAVLFMLAAPTIAFMPSKWTERMSSIGEATEDASFMGRVDAWIINAKLAQKHPVTGAGLRNSYEDDIAASVDRERAERAKAAHSIYFEILGGTGLVGFLLYLAILGAAFLSARAISVSKTAEPPSWVPRFGYYSQISLAVFGVGGASVSLEMWDGYWIVIAMVAAVVRMKAKTDNPGGRALDRANRRRWRMAARGRAVRT